jgi:hypothetical protein
MILLAAHSQNRRCRSVAGPLVPGLWAGALSTTLLILAGCSAGSMPVLRSRAHDAPPPIAASNGADPNAAECAQLRSQIRSNQQAAREAPATSTSPQIVAAEEAKADKRADDTRQQLDELDCPPEGDSSVKLRPLAPMPPAPGAANP